MIHTPHAGHTDAPVKCPILGACQSEKQSAPDWSWLGVALMFLLLLMLLILLEYMRVSGRCCRREFTKEDDVIQLIEAVGFKVSTALSLFARVDTGFCLLVFH